MEFRHLGDSGLQVSAVSYGNWVTHGSQVEAEQAASCVRAALEAGITTFDTADVYANGKAESDKEGSVFIKNLLTDDTLARVQKLRPLAEAEGLTMAQLAIAWVLQNDNVATAITGGSRAEQVAANAAAADRSLSADTMTGIDEALGDAVKHDGSLVGQASPRSRLT